VDDGKVFLMIRVQVTERLIFEANELLDGINHNGMKKRPSFKDEDPLLGAIGEIAVIDYCWNNDLLAYKHQGLKSDVQLHSGHTIEVKVQKVTTPPQMHYQVNFSSMSKHNEKSDFMFFNRVQFVAGKAEAVWLLGGCSWDKFFRMATFHHEGDPMMNIDENGNMSPSGRYFNQDSYDLPISQLAPPSAAVKHFKSLQAKEEAI
jgi:hypothetical protein